VSIVLPAKYADALEHRGDRVDADCDLIDHDAGLDRVREYARHVTVTVVGECIEITIVVVQVAGDQTIRVIHAPLAGPPGTDEKRRDLKLGEVSGATYTPRP
jgi:hypothetical protein